MGLAARAFLSLAAMALVMGAGLFACAGTFDYWQGWAFLAAYFFPSLAITVYAVRYDPELLKRRMKGGPMAEKRVSQRIIMTFASLGFVALLVVPALDRRYGWSHLPAGIVVLGCVLVVAWFALVWFVFRENRFASATIEVAGGQKVIATGPYAVVRHPMYAASVGLFLGAPLALGSLWGLAGFAIAFPAIVLRLLDEETLLARDLPGYRDYLAHVRWRLIPGVF